MDLTQQDSAEACLQRIKTAWDAGDARRYAAEFTQDATYVIFLGDAQMGRAEIERTHIDVLGKWQRDMKMAVKPLSVRTIAPDVVSILTAGGLGKAEPIAYDKLQTFVFVRTGDGWKCAAFQNTKMSGSSMSLHNA